ncbi:rare lipoprotein A [Thermomonospora echinospora]|uniref:Probable endolytic peptidoglycan transglycosylase RlpA n=1 Tax=Thermomonospora echinospora TaxID=1992 RepID=A0A1H6CD79_9ACTN|nr:rare lipoprotein A [Thermomonospora echinospora]
MRACLRTLLTVSGVAVAAVPAGAWALNNTEETGRAAAAPPATPATSRPLAKDPTKDPAKDPAPRRPAATAEPSKTREAEPRESREPAAAQDSKPRKPKYRVVDTGACQASYYWEPQPTASGERFDPDALTAAHKTLPMHSKVKVTNKNNGKSVVVRINDRGPYVGGRCLDLSKAAMASVGGTGSGVIPVRYQVLAKS